ncbi:hypothetical protein WOLCODRAFT_135179 [Wolfiporia cocos MD-104 SS10]|uniref:DNA-directed RNA polymerase III subunit Rpc5 n=1 Tax=Wolfiporia cocos (strain MD-104) TaxID=742152 RepID=A0A2H3IU86_WOLCO|nr:hypothetical protein WOLCODRAFT_135179 [Wolfiporia cocos MD-104 SS10]
MNDPADRLVSVLPVRFSNALAPHIQLHQFPLLTRPLQAPPSAAASGKRIRARRKVGVRRLEVHVPVDTRQEVWNAERARELGRAQTEDDREKNQEAAARGKAREGEEARLGEVRMRSEQVSQTGVYVLGVVRSGQLHLHPIAETHQMRPTLTYMDVLNRKSRRRGGDGSDDDSDDGPPPDPDEPAPVPAPKKEKKPALEAKEVQVSVRKADDRSAQMQGGMTAVRREMLMAIHAEEDEKWEDYEYCDGEAEESNDAFESIFSRKDEVLECKSDIATVLKDIRGL